VGLETWCCGSIGMIRPALDKRQLQGDRENGSFYELTSTSSYIHNGFTSS
jgi:hypothetical protein